MPAAPVKFDTLRWVGSLSGGWTGAALSEALEHARPAAQPRVAEALLRRGDRRGLATLVLERSRLGDAAGRQIDGAASAGRLDGAIRFLLEGGVAREGTRAALDLIDRLDLFHLAELLPAVCRRGRGGASAVRRAPVRRPRRALGSASSAATAAAASDSDTPGALAARAAGILARFAGVGGGGPSATATSHAPDTRRVPVVPPQVREAVTQAIGAIPAVRDWPDDALLEAVLALMPAGLAAPAGADATSGGGDVSPLAHPRSPAALRLGVLLSEAATPAARRALLAATAHRGLARAAEAGLARLLDAAAPAPTPEGPAEADPAGEAGAAAALCDVLAEGWRLSLAGPARTALGRLKLADGWWERARATGLPTQIAGHDAGAARWFARLLSAVSWPREQSYQACGDLAAAAGGGAGARALRRGALDVLRDGRTDAAPEAAASEGFVHEGTARVRARRRAAWIDAVSRFTGDADEANARLAVALLERAAQLIAGPAATPGSTASAGSPGDASRLLLPALSSPHDAVRLRAASRLLPVAFERCWSRWMDATDAERRVMAGGLAKLGPGVRLELRQRVARGTPAERKRAHEIGVLLDAAAAPAPAVTPARPNVEVRPDAAAAFVANPRVRHGGEDQGREPRSLSGGGVPHD